MIDMTKLRAPGWQRVVEELSKPAPSDGVFLSRLLAVLAQVAGARQCVVWTIVGGDEDAEPRADLVWPPKAGHSAAEPVTASSMSGDTPVEHEADARNAARAAAGAEHGRVFGLDSGSELYGDDQKGFVVAMPVPRRSPQEGRRIVTLLLDGRSPQAMQTTLALIEVLVGYGHQHLVTQDLARTRQASAALDLAARLIASIGEAPNFNGGAMQLCNDLTRQLGVDRVAMGWVKGVGHNSGRTKAVGLSDTEHIDRRMTMVQKLEAAMDESLDQEQAVLYPPPPERAEQEGDEADVLLAQAVTHAHRDLASADARLRVASVPLRVRDEVVGVLTIESASDQAPLTVRTVEWLQATMDLVAPVLSVRRSDDRNLALRAVATSRKTAAWALGPKHTWWKVLAIGVFILAMIVTFVQLPYRIEAPVELRSRMQRVVSAQVEGVIARLGDGVERGAQVEAGDVLLELDSSRWELAALSAEAGIRDAQTRLDAALREQRLAEAEQAQAEVDAKRAELALARDLIERSTIRAPISGVIVEGELEQRVGSQVTLGDPLLVLAQLDEMVGVARVDDRDISYVTPETIGSLATMAEPGKRYPISVEKIVPLARPDEGRNAFEVRVMLDEPAAWMRPGMEGLVKLDTGDRSIAWILSRRIRDTLQLWMWW